MNTTTASAFRLVAVLALARSAGAQDTNTSTSSEIAESCGPLSLSTDGKSLKGDGTKGTTGGDGNRSDASAIRLPRPVGA